MGAMWGRWWPSGEERDGMLGPVEASSARLLGKGKERALVCQGVGKGEAGD